MAPANLRVQILTSFTDLLAIGPCWQALEEATGATLPFQTWEWAVAWWKHLHEDSLGVRDHLRVCIIREAGGQLVGIAPLVLTERPAFGPARVRYVEFIGADPNITEVRSILCAAGTEEACMDALRDTLLQRSGEWDWIAWDGLATTRPNDETEHTVLHDVETKPAFILELPTSWPTLKASLGRNIKESLRKCYNSLRRDGLSSNLEIVSDPHAIEQSVEDFFRLHAGRAALPNAPKHPDVFISERSRAFLREVCRSLAARGIARVYRLRVDGRVVAIRIGFRMGPTLYLYYSGWDAEFARYSVMTTLVSEIIQHAIQIGVSSVNLSTGDDVSKTRWGPARRTFTSGFEIAPRASARALYTAYSMAKRAGMGTLARAIVPGLLVRRSPHCSQRFLPATATRHATKLHAAAAAVSVFIALDLLDGVHDGRVQMVSRSFEQWLK